MTEEKSEQYEKPVAYDAEGRPLYAHPVSKTETPTHQVVHVSRSLEPYKQEVSPEVKIRHDRSMELFPSLNLSQGEYVIAAVRRHPIGLLLPMVAGVFLLSVTLSLMFNYDLVVKTFNIKGELANIVNVFVPLMLFAALIMLGTYVSYYVYSKNKLYLTNECLIQETQTSLFSHHEQTVSLLNIEDASYDQKGIVQQLFDYGSIRLSTEGEETTYRFDYVANPRHHIAVLNNAVEAFKLGRPINDIDAQN